MFIPITEMPADLAKYLNSYKNELSKPQQEHFQTYVTGLIICEGKWTITNLNTTKLPGERKDDTSVSRFAHQYKWSEEAIDRQRVVIARKEIIVWLDNRVGDRSVTTYLIFDDSTHEKTGL